MDLNALYSVLRHCNGWQSLVSRGSTTCFGLTLTHDTWIDRHGIQEVLCKNISHMHSHCKVKPFEDSRERNVDVGAGMPARINLSYYFPGISSFFFSFFFFFISELEILHLKSLLSLLSHTCEVCTCFIRYMFTHCPVNSVGSLNLNSC